MLPTEKSNLEMLSHGSSYDDNNCSLIKSTRPKRATFSHSSSNNDDNCSLIKSTKPKRVTLAGSAISAFEDKIKTNKKKGMSNIPQTLREYVADEDAPSFQVPRKNVRRRAPIRRKIKRIHSSMLVACKIAIKTKDKGPTRTNRMKMERTRSRRLQRQISSKLTGLKRTIFKSNKKCQDQNSIVEDKLDQNSIVEDKLDQNSTVEDKLDQNNIVEDKLNQNNIVEDKLNQNRVVEDKLDQNNIVEDKLDQKSNVEDKLDQNNIVEDKLDQNRVVEDKLDQNNIVEDKLNQSKDSIGVNINACDESLNQGNNELTVEDKTPPPGSSKRLSICKELSENSPKNDDNIEQTEDAIESTMSREEQIKAYLSKYGKKLSTKNASFNLKACDGSLNQSNNACNVEVKTPPGSSEELSENCLTNDDNFEQTEEPIESTMSKDERIKTYLTKYGKKRSGKNLIGGTNMKQTEGPMESNVSKDERIRSYLSKYGKKRSRKNLNNATNMKQKGGPNESSMSRDERIRAFLSKYGKKLSKKCLTDVDNKETRDSNESTLKTIEEICQNKDVLVNEDACDVDMQEEELIETDVTNEFPVDIDLIKQVQIEPYLTQEDRIIEIDLEKKNLRIEPNLVMKGDLIDADLKTEEDTMKPKKERTKKMKNKGNKTKKSKTTKEEKDSNKKQIKRKKKNCVKKETDSSISTGQDSSKNKKKKLRKKTKQ